MVRCTYKNGRKRFIEGYFAKFQILGSPTTAYIRISSKKQFPPILPQAMASICVNRHRLLININTVYSTDASVPSHHGQLEFVHGSCYDVSE